MECIGRKLIYRADIQPSLKNETKHIGPSSTSTTGDRDNGELSIYQKFMWEKKMTEYAKQETKLDENFQMAYALIL